MINTKDLLVAGLAAMTVMLPSGSPAQADPQGSGIRLGEDVRLGGEAGAAFFDTGRDGTFPNAEFRIDEAKLFLDAKITGNVFFFAELNIVQREAMDDDMEMGEVYVEVEDLESLWGGSTPLVLRAGRFDIPFGEEYLTRDAVDNPFISHTLADIWGVDEGVELFGRAGLLDYTLAVQNGGFDKLHDGDPDKAVTARAGIRAAQGLRFSASAMRTGDLSVEDDILSEVWFGNTYISPVGSRSDTTSFHADLAQLDATWQWTGGRAAASFGGIRYDDDDSTADNARDALFWSAELVQDVVRRWYAGLRYSQVQADDGFVVPGQGSADAPSSRYDTENIWRLSAVLGHRWNERLVWKAEYSWERGSRYDGSSIRGLDMISTEIACGF